MQLNDLDIAESRPKLEARVDAAVAELAPFAWVSADGKQCVEAAPEKDSSRWIVKVSCGVRPNHQIIPVTHSAVRDLFITEALYCLEQRVLAQVATR